MSLINLTIQEIYGKYHKSTGYLFVAWLHKQIEEALAMQLFITIAMDACDTGETESTGSKNLLANGLKILIQVSHHTWSILS